MSNVENSLIKIANDFLQKINTNKLLENIKTELKTKYEDNDKLEIETRLFTIELYLLAYQLLDPSLLNDFSDYKTPIIKKSLGDLLKYFCNANPKELHANELLIAFSQINEVINNMLQPIRNEINKANKSLHLYQGLKYLHATINAELKIKQLFLNAYHEQITPTFISTIKNDLDKVTQEITPIIDIESNTITAQGFLTTHKETTILNTNFNYLNKSLGGGFRTKCLYTLCGESGKGKTTLAIQLISDFAKQGVKGVFISFEMDRMELICRILSNITSIPYLKLDKYQRKEISLNNNEIEKINSLNEYLNNILVIENNELTELTQLIKVITQLALRGYKFFVIDTKDHLTNTQSKGESYEMHTQIAKSLKELAKEQDISILLLSQANRSIQALKKDELPNRTHMSQSLGTYAQSDGVCFIYVEPESKTLVLYTDKSRYAPKSDEVQMIEIDNECLRVKEINNSSHLISEVG